MAFDRCSIKDYLLTYLLTSNVKCAALLTGAARGDRSPSLRH